MTLLNKPIARKSRTNFRNYGPDCRQIVVTLMPGDVIELRLAGRRNKPDNIYSIALTNLLTRLIIGRTLRLAREKAQAKHTQRLTASRNRSRK